MGAETLQDFCSDFGPAGFQDGIEGLEPLFHFLIVQSVRSRNAPLISSIDAAVLRCVVVQESGLIIHNVRVVPIHSIGLQRERFRITSKLISLISTIEYT